MGHVSKNEKTESGGMLRDLPTLEGGKLVEFSADVRQDISEWYVASDVEVSK